MYKKLTRLVTSDVYKIKCPYSMNPEFIVVHNTANDASALNEIKYMLGNNNAISFHYAVDDKNVIQGIPENRNAWHAGDGANGQGNRKGLAVEICYSKSGGDKFVASEKNAAKFIAETLKRYGWDISKVKKHQDFSKKNCPHRTLELGWDRFLKMVENEMGDANFLVKITASNLNVRSGAAVNTKIVGVVKCGEVFTIVEDVNGWGKLKSGAGYINLKYTERINNEINKNVKM